GYQRLWPYRSYISHKPLKLILAALGAGPFQGLILFWARKHREHHRYTDTELDPYRVNKGLLHAHILWTLIKTPSKTRHVDVSDLQEVPIVVFQDRYYAPSAIIMGWVFPVLVAGFGWNDWVGEFIYTGILRAYLAAFCVNSLAHYAGEQPCGDQRSARNHWIFHHEFPSDYPTGIE
ncbi:hypothetical protein BGW36DRAFT_453077, partial [Talaromyces proteolyticus]